MSDSKHYRALLEKASPLPWLNGERIAAEDNCPALQCEEHADIYRASPDGNCNIACATFSPADAELAVAAVNALPGHLDALDELERILAGRPETKHVSNGEAGDYSEICDGCGQDIDPETHTWKECVAFIKAANDADDAFWKEHHEKDRQTLVEEIARLRTARHKAFALGREMIEWMEKEALPQMGDWGTVSIGKSTVEAIGEAVQERDKLRAERVDREAFLARGVELLETADKEIAKLREELAAEKNRKEPADG